MNLKNRSFVAGSKSYGQMNFQKGRYGVYIAHENRHFANDLRIRRNHFCWIRDVKLLLVSNFIIFEPSMWAWQRKTCFGQLQLNWINQKWAFLQTVSEFDETSFVGTVSSKHSQIYFSRIFGISMWPRQIEMYVQIKYWMFYILIWRKTDWNSRMGLRNISDCVRNGGI